MVEIIINAIDPELAGDPVKDSKKFVSGDVLAVCHDATFVGSITGGILTVSNLMKGEVVPGQLIFGDGVPDQTHVTEDVGGGNFRMQIIMAGEDGVNYLADMTQDVPEGPMTSEWSWGNEEKARPTFRIVKLPNVTMTGASHLVAEELPTDPHAPNRTLQPRMNKLDLATMSGAMQRYAQDHTRGQWRITRVSITDDTLLDLTTTKPPIPDPAVI